MCFTTPVASKGCPSVGQTAETAQPALVRSMAMRAGVAHRVVSVRRILGTAVPRLSVTTSPCCMPGCSPISVFKEFVTVDPWVSNEQQLPDGLGLAKFVPAYSIRYYERRISKDVLRVCRP